MDDFRRLQKATCTDGAPNGGRRYGCSCCRKIANPSRFKLWSRRMAKVRIRRETAKTIAGEG